MRAVIQRVTQASVAVDGEVIGQIETGFLVLLGVESGDGEADLAYLVDKTLNLRIFEDAAGKMNENIQQGRGAVLVVSQFTLLGDCRRGRRPSFTAAAEPSIADRFYQEYCQRLRLSGIAVEQGRFQADMKVSLVNDGPVTILLDSRKTF